MKRKSIKSFIKENRDEIDFCIQKALGTFGTKVSRKEQRINDEERRLWILNDEGLYWWARKEGVQI